MGLEDELFDGERRQRRLERLRRVRARRSPLTTTVWSRARYRSGSRPARIVVVMMVAVSVCLAGVRLGPGAVAAVRDRLADDPVPAQTVQVEVVQAATTAQLEDLNSQVARAQEVLATGAGKVSPAALDVLRAAVQDAEDARLSASAARVTEAVLALERAIDLVAGEQSAVDAQIAADVLAQQQAADQAAAEEAQRQADEAARRAQEEAAHQSTPAPKPAPTPAPRAPDNRGGGGFQPQGPTMKTASQTVTCAGAATVTFTAVGSGNVSLSVSGGGSNSGNGSTSVTVSGTGPFTATGTAVGLAMDWSSSGSSCS